MNEEQFEDFAIYWLEAIEDELSKQGIIAESTRNNLLEAAGKLYKYILDCEVTEGC